MEREVSRPDFWQDQNQAKSVLQRLNSLKTNITDWQDLRKSVVDSLEIAKAADSEKDKELKKDLARETEKLIDKFEKLERLFLFSGKYDSCNAIFSVHAGTGGIEAQDWAQMLLRMLLRYCDKKGFNVSIIDEVKGQEAGIKSVIVEVFGYLAYGSLKSEAGVHRLVRISPFDAEKMRHTSFALVEVIPILPDSEEIEIKQQDLKIDVFRAGGHGGQSVNTTDSAVRITHLPSGIAVKCQNERSQIQNKKIAIRLLQAKLANLQQLAQGKELAKIKGEVLAAQWGNQIRSYVLQPYKMVKDHRTEFETVDPQAILDGELDGFMESYLRYISK